MSLKVDRFCKYTIDLPSLKDLYLGLEVNNVRIDTSTSIQHVVLPNYPKNTLDVPETDSFLFDLKQFNHMFTNNVEELIIPNGIESRRDNQRSSFEICSFPALRCIQIGNNCFQRSTSFLIKQNPCLESICIGKECFEEEEGCFEVSDCPLLKDISILHRSFIRFSECVIQSMHIE